jgi:hypothetical protein
MVIDEILARPNRIEKAVFTKAIAEMRRALPRARRYSFSAKASELAGRLAYECPDLILKNWQFAIPPYPTMYVEFDAKAFFKNHSDPKSDPTADSLCGFLIDHQRIYVMVEARNGSRALCPVGWKLGAVGQTVDTKLTVNLKTVEGDWGDPGARADMAATLSLITAWGEAFRYATEHQDNIDFNVFYDACKPDLVMDEEPWRVVGEKDPSGSLPMLTAQAGDMRNLFALLLWLNQTKHIRYVDVPASSRISRGKRIAYAKQH